jgi:DUF4097 and DUF4098 domain-containing protein YvlB
MKKLTKSKDEFAREGGKMKKIAKKAVAVCSVVLVIGAVAIGVGIVAGGSLNFTIEPSTRTVEAAGAQRDYTEAEVAVEAFDTLRVDTSSADVEMETGETFAVRYCLNAEEEPTITVKDGVLSVAEQGKDDGKWHFFFYLFGATWGNKKSDRIVITVPAGTPLKEVVVNTEYGDVKLSEVQSDIVKITSDSADVQLHDSEMQTCEIVCEYGDVKLADCTMDSADVNLEDGDFEGKNVTFETALLKSEYGDFSLKKITARQMQLTSESGDVELSDSNVTECELANEYGDLKLNQLTASKLKITAEEGDVKATLNGALSDYDWNVTTDDGDFTLNEKKMGTPYIVNEGKQKQITIDTEYGDVWLKVE